MPDTTGFRFIDLPTSAERLGTTRNQLLQWVEEGRIKPFSGSGQQSVFRATDVDKLAREIGASAPPQAAHTPTPGDVEPVTTPGEASAVRTKRRDAIKLMGTRISMDSRWAEITDKDIATWLDALERVQFERVRKVAGLAIERLNRVLDMMDDFERRSRKPSRGDSRGDAPNTSTEGAQQPVLQPDGQPGAQTVTNA